MKILYLTDQIYLHGGIEKVLSQKSNYLADIALEDVIILTHSQLGKKPVYHFSTRIMHLDLDVNYEVGLSYFHPSNLLKIRQHRKELKKAIKNLNPDVVISSSFGPDYYFIPDVCGRIPAIKEYHTTAYFDADKLSIKDRILLYLARRADRKYAKRVVLNEDEMPFYSGSNVTIIPNPTEIDGRKCSLEPKKIIAAGRISYQKNFEALLSAFMLIQREFPDWEVHIYGEDYLDRQRDIQKQVDEAGLQDRFLFKGVTKDLKETFLGYSIYAMTSIHETFPMVLLEALSTGLPIVSYDCPTGPNRIVTSDKDGFIVPYKNSAIFAERLKQLMMNEDLRKQMGAQAKHNAKRFEIATVMSQWKELLNELTAKP